MQQAGPGAVLVVGIGAGSQQERALQGIQGPVDGPDAREGPEIVAFPGPRATMLGDLRRVMVAGQQDIGERLVVAHQDVEARLHLLDVVGLEQQGLGLGRGRDEDHRVRQRDHAGDAVGMPGRSHVAGDTLAYALRLADIEHGVIGTDHAVDAWAFGRVLPVRPDRRRPCFDRVRRRIQIVRCGLELRRVELGLVVLLFRSGRLGVGLAHRPDLSVLSVCGKVRHRHASAVWRARPGVP